MAKNSSSLRLRLLGFLVVALLSGSAHAQFGESKANAAIDKALMRLFGKNAFTAKAEISMTGAMAVSMSVDFAVLDGQTATTFDLGAMRSEMIPAAALEQMKSVGLDKVVSITKDGSPQIIMVYPNAKSYVQFTPPGAEAAKDSEPKLVVTDVGPEKINNQDCTKQKVVITDDKGTTAEVFTWVTPKKLPVQIQTTLDGSTVTMLFKDMVEKKPAASLFSPPGDFKKYDSLQALTMARMMEVLQAPKR